MSISHSYATLLEPLDLLEPLPLDQDNQILHLKWQIKWLNHQVMKLQEEIEVATQELKNLILSKDIQSRLAFINERRKFLAVSTREYEMPFPLKEFRASLKFLKDNPADDGDIGVDLLNNALEEVQELNMAPDSAQKKLHSQNICYYIMELVLSQLIPLKWIAFVLKKLDKDQWLAFNFIRPSRSSRIIPKILEETRHIFNSHAQFVNLPVLEADGEPYPYPQAPADGNGQVNAVEKEEMRSEIDFKYQLLRIDGVKGSALEPKLKASIGSRLRLLNYIEECSKKRQVAQLERVPLVPAGFGFME